MDRRLRQGLSDLTKDAEAVAEQARDDPRRAHAAATLLEQRAVSARDTEARVVALRALGQAAKVLGDLTGAQTDLRRSLALASRAGLGTRVGEARITLSSVLLLRGQAAPALREATRALPLVDGYEAARLRAQMGWILQRLGRDEEALQSYGTALRSLRRMGGTVDAARVLTNRGILQAYRGNFRAAEGDLRQAERLYLESDLDLTAAEVRHNLGFVAARRGDIPAALAFFDAAAKEFERLGVDRPAALLDHCDALLSVGLAREARRLATIAVERLAATGFGTDLAEARLALAQACLLSNANDDAVRQARTAHRAFIRQGRSGWAALARYLELRGQWQRGSLAANAAHRAVEVAADLDAVGWKVAAVDTLLIAGRVATGGSASTVGHAALRAASARRWTGPSEVRARAWHAEALLRLAAGRTGSAMAASRAGLRALEVQQATLGATELRVHAAAHGAELAALGLGLALRAGRPTTALAWAERSRATADRHPRPRPPADPILARDLAALRRLSADIEGAAFSGVGASSSLRRRVALEADIRRRARHVSGALGSSVGGPPSVGQLAECLGDACLVEFLDVAGTLYAITVTARGAALKTLGPSEMVSAEVGHLRFGMDRLARPGAPESSLRSAGAVVDQAARRLDELMMDPLARAVGDRPLVVVPTGSLHDVPWAALPSCARRPVTVAPSARQWLAARLRSRPMTSLTSATLLVAGPGLDHSTAEVLALSALHGDAVTLTGPNATVDSVLSALSRAQLAHVVAHGTLRSDNPMFSALSLSDGPLTVYDLEGVGTTPAIVVLASCHVGTSFVARGDELMGFASSLLGLGTDTVVASVAPVPDTTSVALMLELHRNLRTCEPPAVALAAARTTVVGDARLDDPEAAPLVSLAAFGCMGAG